MKLKTGIFPIGNSKKTTIPAEICRALQLAEGEKVLWRWGDGRERKTKLYFQGVASHPSMFTILPPEVFDFLNNPDKLLWAVGARENNVVAIVNGDIVLMRILEDSG